MKTIVIIPARGGSKRLPGKNLLLLGGIPLIAHSILYAKENMDIIDEIYVSTDNLEIKKVALDFGAKVIDRPIHLSGDNEPTVSAIRHVLENVDSVENVILLQPTNPLRPKELLRDAMSIYQSDSHDSLMTVSQNHQKFGKISNHKFIPYNYELGQRSQDLQPLYFENGLLYISKARLILKNTIFSTNGFPYEINHPFVNVDIDTEDDFELANLVFEKSLKINNSENK